MKDFQRTIRYIIDFLLQNNRELSSHVHYMTKEESIVDCRMRKKQIYIVQSGFFDEKCYGTEESMPHLPISHYDGVRFLYGEAKEELLWGGSLLLYTDIIASAYFLLTRYEEYVHSDLRDQFGRYPARKSLVYLTAGGTLIEPLVDEYGKLLCKKLAEIGHPVQRKDDGFSRILFTHDIDVPFIQYSLIRMLGSIVKRLLLYHKVVLYPFFNYLGKYSVNPQATWNYMLDAEKEIVKQLDIPVETICFIIAAEQKDSCTTPYINDKKMIPILQEMRERGAILGLHTSYVGAEDEALMRAEKEKLEGILGHKVTYHRNHYLRQMHPSDMKRYEDAGFTDDFTTGYAGVAGFKLGTCHPVRFIDPSDGSLHDIVLHPLLIMERSLSGAAPYQMGLDYEQAKSVCKEILAQVWRHNGEVNVLFHNGMFEDIPGNYHKELYDWMLAYIVSLAKSGQETSQT